MLIFGFFILFSVALYYLLYQNIKSDVKENVMANFGRQVKAMNQTQMLIYDRLLESALLIGQNPAFKANLSLGDAPSVDQIVDEFADYLKVDLIHVTDPTGAPISTFPHSTLTFDASQTKGIRDALSGNIPDINVDQPEIWLHDEMIHQTVSIPITTNFDVIGTLTLGTAITDYEAEALQLSDHADVLITQGKTIYAHTSIAADELITFQQLLDEEEVFTSDNILETSQMFIASTPINDASQTFLVNITQKENAMHLLFEILRGMLWIGLGGMLILALGGTWLGHLISAPFIPMIRAFKSVEEGNLNVHLSENRSDEFGTAARAFNRMTSGLQERLQLGKYVGLHTLNRISDQSSHVSKTVKASVLFTDIRGFTEYTQDKDAPTVVEMLNDCLGIQADIIRAHNGVIDKFIGDEIMVLFFDDDAFANAFECGVALQKKSTVFKERYNLHIGIGIHEGEMVMGDLGIEQRKDHTVIGAAVNMSSRLCGIAQKGEIAILKEKSHLISSEHAPSESRTVALKGIEQEVELAIFRPVTDEMYQP